MLRSANTGKCRGLFVSSYCMGQGAVQAVRGAADRFSGRER